MTYNLLEFKTWLNAEPSRKRGKTEAGWNDTFSSLDKGTKEDFADLVEAYQDDEILSPYAAAIKEWMTEIDQRERERERDKTTN